MTTPRLLLALLPAALLAAGAAGSGAAATPTPLLKGETGPGFKIEVEFKGKDAKKLAPGTYLLRVQDKSSIHDFRLKGPGLNKRVTTVGFVGTKTVKVTLKKGVYTYQCDPHAASGMRGTFKVG